MKQNLFLHFTILLAVCLISNSCVSDRVKRNIENSKKLKIGMTLSEALKIMGEPAKIREGNGQPHYTRMRTYYYDTPPGEFDWIYFHIDSTMKIVEIDRPYGY